MTMRIGLFFLTFIVMFSPAYVMAQDLAPDPSRSAVFGDEEPVEEVESVDVDVLEDETSATDDPVVTESNAPPPSDESPTPVVSEKPTTAPDQSALSDSTKESAKEKDPIARATDAQIKEAQVFFKRCSGNEMLDAQHDCRCLAVEFLSTRVQLGDSVNYKKILTSIRSSCLKTDGNQQELPDEGEAGLKEEYTDEELKEAQTVYEYCKGNAFMRRRHDCRCMSAKFLDQRQKIGRFESYELVLSSLRNDCLSGVNMAGDIYTRCISAPNAVPSGVRDVKAYCECYANSYGKEFEASSGNMSMSKEKMLGMVLAGQCASQQGAPSF